MKNLLILGAGTAGTMMANHLSHKLKKDQFYISPMNLNMENSKIEEPYVPVIRYSTPIVNQNGETTGILVANVHAEIVLDLFSRVSKKDSLEYFLVDDNGDYLYHKDHSKQWNAQLGHGSNFNSEHFNINDKLTKNESGVFIHNDKVYSYSMVHSMHGANNSAKNNWYVISSIDTDIALSKLKKFKVIFFLILFFKIELLSSLSKSKGRDTTVGFTSHNEFIQYF